MNEMNRAYFKDNGSGKIILNTYKCEIYVPDAYFESRLCDQNGEIYNLFFICKYRLYHKEPTESSVIPIYKIRMPAFITTKPDSVTSTEMDIYGTKEKIHIFTYYRDSAIIDNQYIVQSTETLERYVNLAFNGKIRQSYCEANEITNKAQKIHGCSLNVTQYTQQLAYSQVYRSKKDLSVPARFIASPIDKDDSTIRAINMRENAAYASTLAGVGFEDVYSMLTVADNRDDKNLNTLSPVEMAIRGMRPKT